MRKLWPPSFSVRNSRPEDARGAGGAAARPLDDGVQVDRRLGEAGRGGDQAGLDLAGSPPLPDHQVAKDAALVPPVMGGDSLAARPVADLVASLVVGDRRELAVLGVDHVPPAAAAMEAEDELSIVLPERVLELVPVAPLLDGRDDRLELELVEAAEPAQRLVDLARLLLQLSLIGQALPRRAGAGLALVGAAIRDPVRARADELDGGPLREPALGLGQPGTDAVPWQAARDEHHIAVGARDAAAALRERVDLQHQLVARAGARAALCLGRGHRPIVAAPCPSTSSPTGSGPSASAKSSPASTTGTSRATSPSWRSRGSTTPTAICSRATRSWRFATSPTRPPEATRGDASPTCFISPSTGSWGWRPAARRPSWPAWRRRSRWMRATARCRTARWSSRRRTRWTPSGARRWRWRGTRCWRSASIPSTAGCSSARTRSVGSSAGRATPTRTPSCGGSTWAGCASRPGGSSRRPRSGMGRCWTTSSSAPPFPA